MNKANFIRLKVIALVIGVSLLMLVVVTVSCKYLVGFTWRQLADRPQALAATGAIFFVFGCLQIWTRLKPWSDYYSAKARGEPPEPDTIRKSFELAYAYPLSAALSLIVLLIIASAYIVFDFARHAPGESVANALLIPVPTLIYFLIAGLVIYYVLKRLFRPILLDLAADQPGILLGQYERSYRVQLLFKAAKKSFRLKFPIGVKLFAGTSLLGLVGVLFFAIAIRQLGLAASPLGGEAKAAILELRRFFIAALAVQVAVSLVASAT